MTQRDRKTTPTDGPPQTGRQPDATFAFVTLLANELSAGGLELPGFPDVILRVRRVLDNKNVSNEDLVRVISTDPSLASRLLQIANSVAYSVPGSPVTDLRAAVGRLGHNLVRTASVAFAMAEMRKAGELRGLERQLHALWERSTLVAALCSAIARRSSTVNADEALLAGLLHGVGRLYILTRARKFPELLADQARYMPIVQQWHATIAGAILETWRIPGQIVEAVRQQEDMVRERRGPADLTDILVVAISLARGDDGGEALETSLQGVSAGSRVQAFTGPYQQMVEESQVELGAMRAALGA